MFVCMYVCMFVCMYVCMYIYTHAYLYSKYFLSVNKRFCNYLLMFAFAIVIVLHSVHNTFAN